MYLNPILKKMGFSKKDKALIVHANDIGVTQSSIDAFLELTDFGTVTCGSAIVPSSWFPLVAKAYLKDPKLDLGIQLAFNCDDTTNRWRPISTVNSDCGFIDENGYFKQNAQEVIKNANPKAVAEEIDSQIRTALNLGLKPSHADSHSLTLITPRFVDIFIEIWEKYGILPVISNYNYDDKSNPIMQQMMSMFCLLKKIDAAIDDGIPVVDTITTIPFNVISDVNERILCVKKMIIELRPGTITHFAFRPSKDTHETRALSHNSQASIADYETFIKKELKDYIKSSGVHLISYSDILKNT